MKQNYGLTGLIVCLALAGCGGGGGGDSPENKPQEVHASPPTLTVSPPNYTDARRSELVLRVNNIRASLGLGLLTQNSKIDAAAQSHAQYMSTNKIQSHLEDPAKPGFTGERVDSRLVASGYGFSSAMEILGTAPESPSIHVDAYLNTLYHRLPIISYNFIDIGVGVADAPFGTVDVLIFGIPGGSIGQEAPNVPYVVWPMRNSTIERGTIQPESPAPPGAGYPISITFDPRKAVSTNRFEVLESGTRSVNSNLLTGFNDLNRLIPAGTAAIVPVDALKPSTSFVATWEGTVDGKPLTVSWGFNTK